MVEEKKETLTYDISSFKSSKLRNSHKSLFKVAVRSFERGDFQTAFELFDKLESDTFLPQEVKERVTKNKKDIEVLIKQGTVTLEKSSDYYHKDKTKEQSSRPKKEIKKEEPEKEETNIETETAIAVEQTGSTNVDSSNIFPIIKEAMTTFADKLASSLSEIFGGQMVKKEEGEKFEESQKTSKKLKEDEDFNLSAENLESLKDISLEGSVGEIYKEKFKSDLYEEPIRKELTEEDINRFLKIGIQFSKAVPEFVDSVSNMKESMEELSKDIPEINKINKDIKKTLDDIQTEKRENILDKIASTISDDDEIVKKLRKELNQSDIFEEYPIETEDKTKKDKFEEEDKIKKEEESSLDKEDLLKELSEKFETIDTKLGKIEEKEDDLRKFNEKIKSHYSKEFDDYKSSSLEESINKLEKDISKELGDDRHTTNKNALLDEINKKYDEIESRLKFLELKEEEIKKNVGNLMQFEQKSLMDKLNKQVKAEKELTEEKLENYLSEDNITESKLPVNNLSDEDLNQLFMDDLMYSKGSGVGSEIQELDTQDYSKKEIYDSDKKSRFVRTNASNVSKKLREQLENVVPLDDDNQVKVVNSNLKEDAYDMQMPLITESDIILPIDDDNKYTKIDPSNLEGNLERIVKLKLVGGSEKYIAKLIEIENEISELIESGGDSEQVEDLSAKLKKIKTHEKLEQISKEIEKEMVVNHSEKEKEKDDTIEESKKEKTKSSTIEEQPLNYVEEMIEPITEPAEVSSEQEGFTQEKGTPMSSKFFEAQEALGKTLDRLTSVLEKSFGKFLESFERRMPRKDTLPQEDEEEDTSLQEKEKKDTFIQKEEETKIDEERAKTKKKEDKERKIEAPAKEEEEEDELFIAKEELLVKKKEKKKKLLPEKIVEDKAVDSSYPDLLPNKEDIEREKEFITLEEILDEELFKEDFYTKEEFDREEQDKDIKISGLDPNFIPGAYIPFYEYTQKDGFFTDIDGNPILAPEEEIEEVIKKEDTTNFIEDEFSIERPEEDEEADDWNVPDEEELERRRELKKKRKKPLKLTFDFRDIFLNKTYLKYRDILNEAAHLVSEKRLDEALEYYNVILDQNIPKAFKLMIQENINDITKTIIDTFQRSDTIVNVKSSGEVTRLKTKFIEEEENQDETL